MNAFMRRTVASCTESDEVVDAVRFAAFPGNEMMHGQEPGTRTRRRPAPEPVARQDLTPERGRYDGAVPFPRTPDLGIAENRPQGFRPQGEASSSGLHGPGFAVFAHLHDDLVGTLRVSTWKGLRFELRVFSVHSRTHFPPGFRRRSLLGSALGTGSCFRLAENRGLHGAQDQFLTRPTMTSLPELLHQRLVPRVLGG